MIKNLNNDNFETEVFNSERPVLVDFFATWCAPCQMLAPTIKQLSDEPISQQVSFAKIDIDKAPDITQFYGVMSVPTLILFNKGKEELRITGVHSKEEIIKKLHTAIGK
jgi:thioredoxin 1